ncbi:hypothetical protein B0H17DRAFT_1194722 [Mycena rosella]|uniref:FAD-binding domain-containing protein n=1 Tax=Mycena rosella TaxID=1033263 RepID=A0AAD7DZ17_MYCRO|nr:hypothetical protein B0H17DRAFT_1194722 [Mycena rosella]
MTSPLNLHGKAPAAASVPAEEQKLVLNILIIGCGIGGLSAAYCLGRAGHKVTILEAASEIGEAGAGIQASVGPNLSRLLIRWGLRDNLDQTAVIPQAITFLRYADGQRVGWTEWGESMEQNHRAPYYHIHRADLLDMLLKLAAPYMTVLLNSRVSSIDPHAAQVTLENGAVLAGDLIIGADGIKSLARTVVVGSPSKPPIPTGYAAYRAIIPTRSMLADPDLKLLVEDAEMKNWMGPGKHIIGYCIRAKTEYNLVMVHPDDRLQESYTAEGSVTKMRADFQDWEPRVQKLLALVSKTLVWPLMYREPLESGWVDGTGHVVFLGDASHAMLPSRAQGCAMAVEDAAVLGVLLSRISRHDQLPTLLHAYQDLRYDRTTETQLAARTNHNIFHLEDGPEQEERDRSMRTAMEAALAREREIRAEDTAGNANVWADKKKSQTQFDYDAELEAEQWCTNHGFSL